MEHAVNEGQHLFEGCFAGLFRSHTIFSSLGWFVICSVVEMFIRVKHTLPFFCLCGADDLNYAKLTTCMCPVLRAHRRGRQPVPTPQLSMLPRQPQPAVARPGEEPVGRVAPHGLHSYSLWNPSTGQPILPQTRLEWGAVQAPGHTQQVSHLLDLHPASAPRPVCPPTPLQIVAKEMSVPPLYTRAGSGSVLVQRR